MRLVYTLTEQAPLVGTVVETTNASYTALTVTKTDEGYIVGWGELESHDH